MLSELPEQIADAYLSDEASWQLEAEYRHLLHLAQQFSEREARRSPADTLPSALDIVAHLAVALLPHGAPPSLSDALHALDLAYAGWQSEEAPFQRVQARQLAFYAGQLALLRQWIGGGSG